MNEKPYFIRGDVRLPTRQLLAAPTGTAEERVAELEGHLHYCVVSMQMMLHHVADADPAKYRWTEILSDAERVLGKGEKDG